MAFYSFVIAIVPLLLIGFSLSTSSKVKKKLKQAESVNAIKTVYSRLKRCLRCRAVIGLAVFVLASNFLLLYIICFCHVASDGMTEDWVRSSVILVVLDLVILELMPGLLFGILGVFYGFCRSSKSFLCLIVAIQMYRLYRNVI